jgi:hypothetical protein
VFEVVVVMEEPPVIDERPRDELAADVSLWLVVVDALDAQSLRLNWTSRMRIDGAMGVCGCTISRRTEG